MFGIIHPQKLLFTILVVVAAWLAWRWYSRQAKVRDVAARPSPGNARTAQGAAATPGAEDMVACKTCGDYVSAKRAVACGRADCPYPR